MGLLYVGNTQSARVLCLLWSSEKARDPTHEQPLRSLSVPNVFNKMSDFLGLLLLRNLCGVLSTFPLMNCVCTCFLIFLYFHLPKSPFQVPRNAQTTVYIHQTYETLTLFEPLSIVCTQMHRIFNLIFLFLTKVNDPTRLLFLPTF